VKRPRAPYRATALKQKAVGKELTHGFRSLPEIPVTCQAVGKPLPGSATTNTSCCFPVCLIGNRTYWTPLYSEVYFLYETTCLVKGKSSAVPMLPLQRVRLTAFRLLSLKLGEAGGQPWRILLNPDNVSASPLSTEGPLLALTLNFVCKPLNDFKVQLPSTHHNGVVVSTGYHVKFFAARGTLNL